MRRETVRSPRAGVVAARGALWGVLLWLGSEEVSRATVLPAEDPIVIEGCDDDCGEPGTSCAEGADGLANTSVSILLARGSITEHSLDLAIAAGGFDVNCGRTYDSRLSSRGAPLPAVNGERWHGGTAAMRCRQSGRSIEIIVTSSLKRTFRLDGDRYVAPDDYNATLIQSDEQQTEVLTLTETDTGDVFVFYGFNGWIDQDESGRIKRRSTRRIEELGKVGHRYSYHTFGTFAGRLEKIELCDGESVLKTVRYGYRLGAANGKLDEIEVFNGVETTRPLQRAEYTYYDEIPGLHPDVGQPGDLVQVKVSLLASDGVTWIDRYKQYRYYADGDADGGDHQLKAVFEPEAVERVVADRGSVGRPETILTRGDDDVSGSAVGVAIADFASQSFRYYTSDLHTAAPISTAWGVERIESKYGGRNVNETDYVKEETVNGRCAACRGGADGTVTRRYYYMELANPEHVNEVVAIRIEDTTDTGSQPVYRSSA